MEGLKEYCTARGFTEIKEPPSTEAGGRMATVAQKGLRTVATVTYTTIDVQGKTVTTAGAMTIFTSIETAALSSAAMSAMVASV